MQNIQTTKTCIHCQEAKPLEAFPLRSKARQGCTEITKRHTICRDCRSRLALLAHHAKKHGWTGGEYIALLERQNGVCALCQQGEVLRKGRHSDQPRPLAVDHDHQTGEVRGLLCSKCNWALGILETFEPGWFDRLSQYLDEEL